MLFCLLFVYIWKLPLKLKHVLQGPNMYRVCELPFSQSFSLTVYFTGLTFNNSTFEHDILPRLNDISQIISFLGVLEYILLCL